MSNGVTLPNLLKYVYYESSYKSIIDSYLDINKIIKLIEEKNCNKEKISSYLEFSNQFDSCYEDIVDDLTIKERHYLIKYKDVLFEEVYNIMSSDNDESDYD